MEQELENTLLLIQQRLDDCKGRIQVFIPIRDFSWCNEKNGQLTRLHEAGYITKPQYQDDGAILQLTAKGREYLKGNVPSAILTNDTNCLGSLISEVTKLECLFENREVSPLVRGPRTKGQMIKKPMIHDNPEFMIWKAKVLHELAKYPENDIIIDIRKSFRSMEDGMFEVRDFNKIKADLEALNSYRNQENTKTVFSEGDFINRLINALQKVQQNISYANADEDTVTRGIRDMLDDRYEISDQSQQGLSENGKRSGEVDLLVRHNGAIQVFFEAVKIDSVEKDNIKEHLDKLLVNYDRIGCKCSVFCIYYAGKYYQDFWTRFQKYFEQDYQFPENLEKDSKPKYETPTTDSRHAIQLLKRNGISKTLHILAIKLPTLI